MWLWTTLQIAFAAGLATTFDDNIYLTAFFGEVNRVFRPMHVVVGEFLGFSLLLAISLLGYGLGMALPAAKVGLLGILPILIGLNSLLTLLRPASSSAAADSAIPSPAVRAAQGRAMTGSAFRSRRVSVWDALVDRRTYDVSLVSISNGSNNLSIYIPLFASLSLARILVVIPVLYLFIATWLTLSFTLTRMPGISLVLNRYARVFFPFILMWLGYRILRDSGAFSLLQ